MVTVGAVGGAHAGGEDIDRAVQHEVAETTGVESDAAETDRIGIVDEITEIACARATPTGEVRDDDGVLDGVRGGFQDVRVTAQDVEAQAICFISYHILTV